MPVDLAISPPKRSTGFSFFFFGFGFVLAHVRFTHRVVHKDGSSDLIDRDRFRSFMVDRFFSYNRMACRVDR